MRPPLTLLPCSLLLLICLAAAPGCEDPVEHPPAVEEVEALRATSPAAEGDVVARVNGRALGLDALQAYWRQHPTLSREEALEGLVAQELWAQRAVAEELAGPGTLEDARRRGLARALLRREVLEAVDEASIPKQKLDEEIEALIEAKSRPAGARVSHILVRVPEQDPETGAKLDEARRQALMARAEAQARALRARLGPQTDLLELGEVARQAEVETPLQVRVEPHLVTALQAPADESKDQAPLPQGWIRAVAPFREAVAQMARRGAEHGAVSEPVGTRFGWHVIMFQEHLEARRPEPEEVRQDALQRLMEARRGERAQALLERLGEGVEVELRPEALEQEQGGAAQGSER